MSVVVVIGTRKSTGWEGYQVDELAPPLRVGFMPGRRALRLVPPKRPSAPMHLAIPRLLALAAIVCVAMVIAIVLPLRAVQFGGAGPSAAQAGPSLATVPLGAVGPISAVLGRDLPGYRVTGLATTNAEQDLRATFSSSGVTVVSGGLRLGIALDGYGYAGAPGTAPRLSPLTGVAPVARANRVLYAHGALNEWWANGPAGLEQGFTVSSAPGVGTGPLTLSLALSGNVQARLAGGGGGLYLAGPGGALRYDDLAATDARGRSLPARFALYGGHALIEVDDQGATYPVRVDPLVQQSGELISSGGTPSGYFGRSVAVSGNTVAVAADNQTVGSSEEAGAVYVFVEPAGGWSELGAQSAELVASGTKNPPGLGWALAMSGATVVATSIVTCNKAGPTVFSPCLNKGAAYVFQEPGGGWSGVLHQNAVLTSSNLSAPSHQLAGGDFGASAAISGGTIVVGALDQHVGPTLQVVWYVFQQPGGGWSGDLTQSAELTVPSGAPNESSYNEAVAVSAGTIVVGAWQDGAFVFQEPSGGWSGLPGYAAKLTGPPGAGIDDLGSSVAVSGGTVALGAPAQTVGPNADQGAVFVYNEPAAGWSGTSSPAAELTASDGTGDSSFGSAVAASGSSIAVGEQDRSPGSLSHVYLFTEPAAGWSGPETESSELAASNEAVTDAFASDVALSCGTVVVGAAGHHRLGNFAGPEGAAYVFAPPTPTSAGGARVPAAAGHGEGLATPAPAACALLVTGVTATSAPAFGGRPCRPGPSLLGFVGM